ncbi:hypothetical protein [Actinoallomurus sp. CA-142502]|uniref:hypothetical protein n=1 Tax=Actinoallomurus sp. CA-142502 TaxID=3239885 RepID=UPI003D8FC07C
MRGITRHPLAGLTGLAGLAFLACLPMAGPAVADDTPSPSPSATVGTAGTSFLTATAVDPGQQVRVSASTGDYLYWSFDAAAGETDRLAITITLPTGASRHGPATWTVDVFDGLRRRQPCTAGSQTATAAAGAATLALHCLLRQVRTWADPWSDEPLPGTYYVRLSATGLPDQDLGLPVQTDLSITAKKGDAQPDNARLKAPLSPETDAGSTTAPQADSSAAPSAEAERTGHFWNRISWPSTRWWWTIGGGLLAALAGVGGYRLTRHPRRWFS